MFFGFRWPVFCYVYLNLALETKTSLKNEQNFILYPSSIAFHKRSELLNCL